MKKRMWKRVLFVACLAWCGLSFAAPKPFGIEIGKTTLKEVKEKYTVIKTKDAPEWNAQVLTLQAEDFSSGDRVAKSAFIVLSPEGKTLALEITYGKKCFKEMHEALSAKYKTVYRNDPFVGDRAAKYEEGDVEIVLEEPHLGFETRVTYATKSFWNTFRADNAKEEELKKKQLEDNL